MASQDLAGQTSSNTTTNHGTSTNAEAEKLKGHLERGAGHIAMSHELKADGQKKVVSGYEQKIGKAPDSAYEKLDTAEREVAAEKERK